jgi:hypothetical protein
MPLVIMYALMIFDLIMTLMHHEESGELNPLFKKLLIGQPFVFIYLKLAFNSIAAIGIIVLLKYRPLLGRICTYIGLVIYLFVAYIHIEVYRVNHEMIPLIPPITKFYESFFY